MDPRYGAVSEHRVSMLGSSLRRLEDPEQSRDPRVRELVEALRAVDYAPPPAARFRAELRAQLVAVAPQIIAESASTADTERVAARSTSTRTGEPASHQAHRRRFARPLAVAAGLAAAFLILLGGAVWKSQTSLPGDSLYGLKRASENVQLALSSGGTARGHEYLRLAQTRVEEARALLRRESSSAAGSGTLAGGLSPHTAKLISSNLSSADSDLTHGTDLLSTQAVTAQSQTPITLIADWAPGQLTRLQDLAAALPQGSLQNRTTSSWKLTNSALTRARSLAPAVARGCASTAKTDPLGPVPTCGKTAPKSTNTPSAPKSSNARTTRPGTGERSPGGSGSPRPAATGSASRHRAPSSPAQEPSSSSRVVRPLLPSVPVSAGSCGISVAVGPIGVGVGGCSAHS